MIGLMTSFLLFDQKREVTKGLFVLRITQNSILKIQFPSLKTLSHISCLNSLFFFSPNLSNNVFGLNISFNFHLKNRTST